LNYIEIESSTQERLSIIERKRETVPKDTDSSTEIQDCPQDTGLSTDIEDCLHKDTDPSTRYESVHLQTELFLIETGVLGDTLRCMKKGGF